jgi:pimeloyl-ACP methyl ester carboxylesterase
VWIGCLISGLIAAALVADQIYRRLVAPKVRDIFENVPPFNVVIEPIDPEARRISFTTSDGIILSGSILNEDVSNPAGLVLFLPELRGNQWMARRYCKALLEQGFVVLAFDFRNQGESACMRGYSPIHWITEYEMADIAAALEYIESDPRLGTLPIIAFGVSRGGVAALLAACRYPRIRGVIADSAFGTMSMIRFFVDRFVQHVIPLWLFRLLPAWHVSLTLRQAVAMSESSRHCTYAHLEAEVKALESENVLLISGSKDSYVTPEIASRLHAIVGLKAELWIAEGAKHNMSRAIQPNEYDRRVLAHACQCLGTADPDTKRAENNERDDFILLRDTNSVPAAKT